MRILHLDIETAPNTASVWGLWKQNVSLNQILESSYVMCWSAKWHHERKVLFMKHTEKDFLETIWNMLNKADVVVHYNGKKFDIPTLNKEFALKSMPPPDPYKQIDLLQVVRSKFKFPSNKLDYVAQQFGVGKKHAHEGHELWVKCMNGDKAAWKRMERYNKQDVRLLENLYEQILPWIDNHPNAGIYITATDPVCTNCGSDDVIKKGIATTRTQRYQRYRCNCCGTPLRARMSTVDRDERENILIQEKI